jgi:hypothetical protein
MAGAAGTHAAGGADAEFVYELSEQCRGMTPCLYGLFEISVAAEIRGTFDSNKVI